jgi:trehalose 6-phosphate synthase/phosphatase
MTPILKRTGGIWIGWDGNTSGLWDEKRRGLLEQWTERDGYIAVDLPPEVAHGFYDGFANQALWPLLHHFTSMLKFDPVHWSAYVEANERFRDVVLEHLQPGDLVWVHDYQLMLLPQMLRKAAPDANIGFFLHVPFPSSAVFRVLPRRSELLEGLIGADYIAFHTHSYVQHFRASLLRILGISSQMDRVELGSRTVRLDALPIGVAAAELAQSLNQDPIRPRLAELRTQFHGCQVIIAVDRLDYTKGISERLRAYRLLLDRWPELQGKVVLVQVAVPSRERVPMYSQLRREVDELVGKINGEMSSPDWTPIVYIRRSLPQSELTALYALADVGWVTPLRDGLNLVAKEYVACNESADGALVLSEFAGAAAEMGEAFLVNPIDEERTAEVVRKALTLTKWQRKDRMSALRRRVARNNVFAWGDRFVANLKQAATARAARASEEPQKLPYSALCRAFCGANERLLLLDYDGTLVPFSDIPSDAAPDAQLVRVLAGISEIPETRVAVVSGRSTRDLQEWFRDAPGLWLAAEHGAILRPPNSDEWRVFAGRSGQQPERVSAVLEEFVDRTPGSFLEQKEFSVVWHYRMADPEFGEWLSNELVANLDNMLIDTEFRVVHGSKSVEVRPIWANKGQVKQRLTNSSEPDFVLAAGDDRTDEDLFGELPASSWTIHVGQGGSRARYQVSGPQAMQDLLGRLLEVWRSQSRLCIQIEASGS